MSQWNLSRVLDELRALLHAVGRPAEQDDGRTAGNVVREEPGSCDVYIRMMCMHAELYQFASALCDRRGTIA